LSQFKKRMDFIDDNIQQYSEAFSQPESELLKELNRQTHIKVGQPRMLSGHLQGRFLSMISHLLKPKFILEIGTYTGYSALCLAEGLRGDGKLVSIDSNEETNLFAQNFINKSEFKSSIELIRGDAQKIIPQLQYKWDLIFIDADKINYAKYFDLVIEQVNQGGLIVADNVLWSGKVLDDQKDRDTLAIHQFNEKVSSDPRVESLLLPVRDGLMLLRKK
jgi:caffeoyl-CoA O-methyltransferase